MYQKCGDTDREPEPGMRNRCKRGRRTAGKSAVQSKDVTRSEIKVAKPVSWLSGKAAIVYIVPVP